MVFDRFHVVKLVNEKLTRLRRESAARGGGDEEGDSEGEVLAAIEKPGEP